MTIATLIEKLQEDISWLGYNETEREIVEHIKRAITLLKEQEAELLQQEAELDILRNIYKQENPNKQVVKWE